MEKRIKASGFIRTYDHESRVRLIEYLEGLGYILAPDEVFDRQGVIDCRFPLRIDSSHKQYGTIHNTTCAAAACSKAGTVITEDEFYKLMKEGKSFYE